MYCGRGKFERRATVLSTGEKNRKGESLRRLAVVFGVGLAFLFLFGTCQLASAEVQRLEVVNHFDSPDFRPRGLAWDGENLWVVESINHKIYKINTSGNVISLFDSPDSQPEGLTWGGEHLWLSGSKNYKIYELDTSGNVISLFDSPGAAPIGLAWDGEHFWNVDWDANNIYKLDTNGNVISLFDSPIADPQDMAWDGVHLWICSAALNKIYELDNSENVSSSFDSPGSYPYGLEWGGEYLWISDWEENRIYCTRLATYYELSVTADNGSVTVTPENELYIPGSQVALTATPAEGYEFAGWGGDVSGSASSIQVTMDSDKTVTANFRKIEGLPLLWIGVGAAVIIALLAALYLKRVRK